MYVQSNKFLFLPWFLGKQHHISLNRRELLSSVLGFSLLRVRMGEHSVLPCSSVYFSSLVESAAGVGNSREVPCAQMNCFFSSQRNMCPVWYVTPWLLGLRLICLVSVKVLIGNFKCSWNQTVLDVMVPSLK